MRTFTDNPKQILKAQRKLPHQNYDIQDLGAITFLVDHLAENYHQNDH